MSWLAPAGTRPADHRLPGLRVRAERGLRGTGGRSPRRLASLLRRTPCSSSRGRPRPAPGINATGTPRGWCDHCWLQPSAGAVGGSVVVQSLGPRRTWRRTARAPECVRSVRHGVEPSGDALVAVWTTPPCRSAASRHWTAPLAPAHGPRRSRQGPLGRRSTHATSGVTVELSGDTFWQPPPPPCRSTSFAAVPSRASLLTSPAEPDIAPEPKARSRRPASRRTVQRRAGSSLNRCHAEARRRSWRSRCTSPCDLVSVTADACGPKPAGIALHADEPSGSARASCRPSVPIAPERAVLEDEGGRLVQTTSAAVSVRPSSGKPVVGRRSCRRAVGRRAGEVRPPLP